MYGVSKNDFTLYSSSLNTTLTSLFTAKKIRIKTLILKPKHCPLSLFAVNGKNFRGFFVWSKIQSSVPATPVRSDNFYNQTFFNQRLFSFGCLQLF